MSIITILGMIIFLVFALIWYLPLYKSKPEDKKPEQKLFWKAFFMGLGPAFVIGLILPCIIGFILRKCGYNETTVLFKLLVNGVGYGIGEELSKFLIAFLILRKIGYRNQSHTALLFGAVGLGFGVFESFLVVTSLISAIVRAVFCLHVFFQFWMGSYYADSIEKKIAGDTKGSNKSMLLAFVVPMLVHIIHDVVGYQGLSYMAQGAEETAVLGVILFIASVVIDIVFIISTLRMVRKS